VTVRGAFSLLVSLVLVSGMPQLATADDGTVTGRVHDPEGHPLEGVRVVASADTLAGSRVATSDREGRFWLPALPPGAYLVSFELEGYQYLEFAEVEIPLNEELVLVATLKATEGDETVSYRGGPSLSASSASVVEQASGEARARLPGEELACLPQATARPVPTAEGMGCPWDPAATQSHGNNIQAALENQHWARVLAGVDPGVAVPPVTVSALTPRRGTLHGAAHAYLFDHEVLGGASRAASGRGESWQPEQVRGSAVATGGSLSARSSFHLGLAWQRHASSVSNQAVQRPQQVDDTLRQALGVLRWQPAERHRIDLRLEWNDGDHPREASSRFVAGATDSGSSDLGFSLEDERRRLVARWGIVATDRWSLELRGVANQGRTAVRPASVDPSYQDLTLTGSWSNGLGGGVHFGGAGFVPFDDRVSSQELEARLEWQARSAHRIRLGASMVEGETERRLQGSPSGDFLCVPVASGGAMGREPCTAAGGGAGVLVPFRPGDRYRLGEDHLVVASFAGAERMTSTARKLALYAEDVWRPVDALVVHLGLRVQTERRRGATGERLDLHSILAPRLGLAWDFGGQGRSRLYLHAGRTLPEVSGQVRQRLAGVADYELFEYDYPASGRPGPTNPGVLRAALATSPAVLGEVEAPAAHELVIGAETEILTYLVVGCAGSYQALDRTVDAYSIDEGRTVIIGDRSDAGLSPSADRRSLLELYGRRRFADGWQLDATLSYVAHEGDQKPGLQVTRDLDSGIEIAYETAASLSRSRGPAWDDRRWRLRLHGSRAWSSGAELGWALGWARGAPVSRLGVLSPALAVDQRFVNRRGTGGRTPDIWQLDLRLAYPLADRDIELWLEVLNALDAQASLIADERWTVLDQDAAEGLDADAQRSNPEWGHALLRQAPRRLWLGLTFTW
jgi:hypothetical protein